MSAPRCECVDPPEACALHAAAPSMYTVLRQVERVWAMDRAQMDRLPKRDRPPPAALAAMDALLKRIRAAITEAQGGTPPPVNPPSIPLGVSLVAGEMLEELRRVAEELNGAYIVNGRLSAAHARDRVMALIAKAERES